MRQSRVREQVLAFDIAGFKIRQTGLISGAGESFSMRYRELKDLSTAKAGERVVSMAGLRLRVVLPA
jgi:hypothetical protein